MAYDTMGNYTGYEDPALGETEEERRQRLLREAAEKRTPVKQTITTDPTTGQQTMTISGDVRDLSPQNPRTPTVTGPVSPDMTAIRQVESGNRDFTPAGQPVTSPRGAMFASQVMPSTAANPGFGVRPAQAQTPEEYNRVGRDYYNAMLQRYGGDREKALAAYNAGPGRVDRNMAANQGQLNTAQLPRETQGYVPKVLDRIIGGLIPSAQAAEVPRAPVQPTAPVQPGAPAPQMAPQGQMPPARPVAPTPSATETAQPYTGTGLRTGMPTIGESGVNWDTLLTGSQTNPNVRQQLITDPNTPPMYRQAAISNEKENVQQQRDQEDALRKVRENKVDIAAEMKKEGSLIKAIIFGYAGAGDLARNELNKMGYGGKWESVMDDQGNRALIKYRTDGIPMEGYNEAGQALTAQQVAQFGTFGAAGGNKFKPEIGGAYVLKDNQGNVTARGVRTTRTLPNGTTQTMIESGGKLYDINRGWEPESISTQTEKTLAQKRINLAWDPIIKAATTSADELTKAGLKYGLDLQIAGRDQSGQPVIVDKKTNQILKPDAQGQVSVMTSSVLPPGGIQALETAAVVSQASQKMFAEKRIPEIIDEGSAGSEVARIRREQLDTIRNNPSILGIYQGRGDNYDRARNIITKVISGAYGQENDQELFNDLKAVSLGPAEKAALENFANLNMQINTKTLKANTGGGQISNAEQKINQRANLSNIAEQTALASMQGLHRSMFNGELNAAKSGFLVANESTLNTDAKFQQAWSKKKGEAIKAYEGVMRERAEFLQNYVPPRNATPQQIATFNERVFKAFEMYPAPRWDSEKNKWDYGTKNAEAAAARALLGR